eukprot:5207362-Pyramimonas_sp.AAC.1
MAPSEAKFVSWQLQVAPPEANLVPSEPEGPRRTPSGAQTDFARTQLNPNGSRRGPIDPVGPAI